MLPLYAHRYRCGHFVSNLATNEPLTPRSIDEGFWLEADTDDPPGPSADYVHRDEELDGPRRGLISGVDRSNPSSARTCSKTTRDPGRRLGRACASLRRIQFPKEA